MGTISALSFSEASRIAFDTDKTIAHTKGYVISQKGYTNHDVVLLLSSSCQVKFCENFTNEDNFNNTFSLKSFRTTAVATEFRGKGNTIFQDSKNKTGLCCIKPILRVYMLIFISRKGRKGNDDDDDDDKTISPGYDKHINVPFGAHYLALTCSISLYLALSRKAQNLCSIFATANGKRRTIHPLRFARRPCLRGTVSYSRHL